MKINQAILVLGLAWALGFASCKTREAAINKQTDKQVISTEAESKTTLQKDSTSTRNSSGATQIKKDIISVNKDQEVTEEYFPPSDSISKPALKSRTVKSKESTVTDKTIEIMNVFRNEITNLKSELKDLRSKAEAIKSDSSATIKEAKSDSTLAANIPWWVWLVAISVVVIFYFMYKSR